jgi:chloramphenicol O-acetyltransferase type A
MKDTKNKNKIDFVTWNRKEHFDFFKDFEQPFWGITTVVDCTEAYRYCKENDISFSTFYLYKSLLAANEVKEFRYRIEGDAVVEYEFISGSVTVLRKDETFGFANFDYNPDFKLFRQDLEKSIVHEKENQGLRPDFELVSLIHYSVLPLVQFTSFQHAQKLGTKHSVPQIVFGKFHLSEGRMKLPVSVHVHHALCDGFHVGKFITAFEKELAKPDVNPGPFYSS